jgi:hypothetical protein
LSTIPFFLFFFLSFFDNKKNHHHKTWKKKKEKHVHTTTCGVCVVFSSSFFFCWRWIGWVCQSNNTMQNTTVSVVLCVGCVYFVTLKTKKNSGQFFLRCSKSVCVNRLYAMLCVSNQILMVEFSFVLVSLFVSKERGECNYFVFFNFLLLSFFCCQWQCVSVGLFFSVHVLVS